MSDSYHKYYEMTPEDAKQWMDAMKPGEYVLLDVRMQEEYDACHIEGAMLIADYEIKDKMESMLPDKTKPIFIYCRSGVRSKKAAQVLADAGYHKVYEFGGILDWKYETITNY